MAGTTKKNMRLNSVSAGTETVIHVIMAAFSLCCILPFIFVIIIAFSSEESIRAIGYSFVPQAWSVNAFSYAFEKLPQIWRSYFNSILITVIGTVLSTLMCAMYSYVLYRPDFKFRGFFNFFSFFTTALAVMKQTNPSTFFSRPAAELMLIFPVTMNAR